jgi:hypothetical protein
MELALNLVWVCVASIGIAVQFMMPSRVADTSSRPQDNWRKIVAMTCGLVILFFVISMTDDLHDQEIVVEENKSSRILSGAGASSLFAPDRVIPVVCLLSSSRAHIAPALAAVRNPVEPSEVLFAAAIDCDPLCGRAPPTSLA